MKRPLTISTQDYLKHIYELTEHNASASTNTLAARLKVRPASVTGMIQKLANEKPALVKYQKHQGVTLTKAGRRAALEVIRHHRLLETWLVQTLGYSWDEVHEEAERLEHVISEDFEQRVAEALGHPLRDPHGELIPTADLEMPLEDATPLSTLRKSQRGTIVSVRDANADLLRYLEKLGLIPNTHIEAIDYSPFDHNLTIKVGEQTHVLGLSVTNKILIKED
ncbi:MAG: metal-dependent transcriptional regulator [Anaerolineales bacterium]|nr:metal-dependent transcriptional regulator [Anaerolineales bacterium]